MARDQRNDDVYVDANGCLTERVAMDGQDVIVHYDDVPESDITSINGMRCTTALRTVIDVAPGLDTTNWSRWPAIALTGGCSPSKRQWSELPSPTC